MADKRTTRGRRLLRLLATALVLVLAALAALVVWEYYVTAPWTRDGRVRVQVASIAPQVSGQITELRVVDNQFVRRGDVLFVIDPYDFRIALDSARAEVENRAADLQVKRAQAARREALTTISTSIEEKQQFAGTAKQAEAAYASAQAQAAQAEINLRRTEVRSPVNGYVTNLLLRVGDYATAGTRSVSVIDADSYWIDGYFEETKMARIRVGDDAAAALMGYAEPIRGRVESITRGISTANAAPSTQGLPSVDPVYTWVRLAQRVPVRIRIEAVPRDMPLVAGMTATVSVGDYARQGDRLRDAFSALVARIGPRTTRDPAVSGPEVTTTTRGASTVSRLPVPEPKAGLSADEVAPGIAPGINQAPEEAPGAPDRHRTGAGRARDARD
ncbi:p-hydroxybenzoic acid efflux pump subunit AaeA [Methylobacterium crusticola]|uniref:p-hydroxybenzoic acid efflux pump subunit AaeA n=1 Tax=Methylobacterium crusticola TaxID=1697972 RepID=A0ABQ4QW25_9HYPH|nr:HlyD family secretion protein [Methylobacterium crusticola]GJD49553.1 p-hydroxybenzoic acid efflux pump subunit AaeA [Methylobacterium crusticola]